MTKPTAKQVQAAKAKYELFGLKIENARKKAGLVRGTGTVGELQRKRGQAYTTYMDLQRAYDAANTDVKENYDESESINLGDPVKIVGNVNGAGETGVLVDIGMGGKFLVVKLDSTGTKHSYHASDVRYYENDDMDESVAAPTDKTALEARLAELKRRFDPEYDFSDDQSFVRAQVKIRDEMKSIKKQLESMTESITEAHKVGDQVKMVKGPKDVVGKIGRIGEIRHGAYKGAPKTYTVDYDSNKSIQLTSSQLTSVQESVRSIMMDSITELLNEARMPLADHPYHKKTDAELKYIIKDAGKSAKDFKGEKSEAKYLDQVNDASTVLYYRKTHPDAVVNESTMGATAPPPSTTGSHFAIHLDGRKWKVFADKAHAAQVGRNIRRTHPKKQVQLFATTHPVSESTVSHDDTTMHDLISLGKLL